MNTQISVQSIATDCLNSTKYMVLRDAYGTMESTTPQVRQAFKNMADEHLKMADDWFRLMAEKGWYIVPQANPNLSNQMVNHLQNLSQQGSVYSGYRPQQNNQQYY